MSKKSKTKDFTLTGRNELGRFIDGNRGTLKRYESKEELIVDVIEYFEVCEKKERHLTMTGLALALGFRSRTSLVAYQKEEGYEFAFEVIQFAKMKIEEYLEQSLLDPKKRLNLAGYIFTLKNGYGWSDRQEIRMDQRTIQLTGFNMNRNDDAQGSATISE